MAKFTPSTAFTQPTFRHRTVPVLTGKYFCRSCSSSSGPGILFLCLLNEQPAPRRPIRSEAAVGGLLLAALRHGVGATRVERAAGRDWGAGPGWRRAAPCSLASASS